MNVLLLLSYPYEDHALRCTSYIEAVKSEGYIKMQIALVLAINATVIIVATLCILITEVHCFTV